MEYKAKELIKLLKKNGWQLVNVEGSHHTFKKERTWKLITVPLYKKALGKGLANAILKEAGLK